MSFKFIINFLLAFFFSASCFADDSTRVQPISTASPALPSSYLLGVGTVLGVAHYPGYSWTVLTQTINSGAAKTFKWRALSTSGNQCAAGYATVINYGLAQISTGGGTSTSVGATADLCFRINPSSYDIEIYIMNLLNKRPAGSSDNFALINYSITCMLCSASSPCNKTTIYFPQPYKSSGVEYNCNLNPPS